MEKKKGRQWGKNYKPMPRLLTLVRHEQLDALDEMNKETAIPRAELIRRALDLFIKNRGRGMK